MTRAEDRARLLACPPVKHVPNPSPDPLGEPIGPEEDEGDVVGRRSVDPLAGSCTRSKTCPNHIDDILEAYRNGQEDLYLEGR